MATAGIVISAVNVAAVVEIVRNKAAGAACIALPDLNGDQSDSVQFARPDFSKNVRSCCDSMVDTFSGSVIARPERFAQFPSGFCSSIVTE